MAELTLMKTASELTQPGWYWWRFRSEDAWTPQWFDPINKPAELRLMGGYFIGPIYPNED